MKNLYRARLDTVGSLLASGQSERNPRRLHIAPSTGSRRHRTKAATPQADPGARHRNHGREVEETGRCAASQPSLHPPLWLCADRRRLVADTPFKQQKLKAWQPILTPNWVIGTFAVVGLIFIPIGIVLHTESENVRPSLPLLRVCSRLD
jgi:hypothetical protein